MTYKTQDPKFVDTDFRCSDCELWTPEAPLFVEEIAEGDAVVHCPQCGGGIKWVSIS